MEFESEKYAQKIRSALLAELPIELRDADFETTIRELLARARDRAAEEAELRTAAERMAKALSLLSIALDIPGNAVTGNPEQLIEAVAQLRRSLRDEFAIAAIPHLQRFWADRADRASDGYNPGDVARAAFELADEMMEYR